MDKFSLKPKTYQKTTKSLHITKLRSDLQAFAPNLPWHDYSLEGGYIFSHLDGEMVGAYKSEREEVLGTIE